MDERLRHRLELQALEIEELFARHAVRAQVEGGHARPDNISFVATGQDPIDAQTQRQLRAELEDIFNAPEVELLEQGSKLHISIRHTIELALLDLLQHDLDRSPGSAALGWSTEDRPLQLNFNETMGHAILIGAAGAGKTAALRTCAVSLALASRQSQVQMLFFDPRCDRPESGAGPGLAALHYLPHALAAVVTELEDAADVLAFLAQEAAHRRTHAIHHPTIVAFLDNVDVLLDEGTPELRGSLQTLLARGAASGVHLVMAARPSRAEGGDKLADVLALKQVLRLVGKLDNARQAQAAALIPQLGAENLQGRGDFLLAAEEEPIRFQAAFVDSYDLHWCLETLQRQRPPAIVARPATARPTYTASLPSDQAGQSFSFDGRQITLEQETGASRST